MRFGACFILLPALLLTAACRDTTLTVRGTLAPGSGVTDVYVAGQPVRAPVQGDSFVVQGIAGDSLVLEFVQGDERRGRMSISGWNGSPLVLRGVWMDRGAHPRYLEGETSAQINGLRMAPAGSLPARIDEEGVVLAVSLQGDAFVARPRDRRLPDLRVVITPGTVIEGRGGAALEEPALSFGDLVRLQGTVEAGYLVATRLELQHTGEADSGSPSLHPRDGRARDD